MPTPVAPMIGDLLVFVDPAAGGELAAERLANTVRTRGQARRALWAMILVGTAIAVVGVVPRMTWNGHLYWVGPQARRRRRSAPS